MRIAFGFLPLLPLLAGCVSPPPADANDEQVLRAVLAYQARSEVLSHGSVCVDLGLDGVGLDQLRALRRFEASRNPDLPPAVRDEGLLGWGPASAGGDAAPAPLAPEQQSRLVAAAARLMSGEAPPAASSALARDWIPAPLAPASLLKRLLMRCSGSLTLSNAAIAGPVAFVDVAFDCGGMCGFETVIALERRGSIWTVVGERLTMES